MKDKTRTTARTLPRKTEPRRAVRETTARYGTKSTRRVSARRARWKIPTVTPVGAHAPVSETLPLAVKRIVDTLHPEKIILFGSYAYGTPTSDSDVDLLVVMPSQEAEIERYLRVSRLLRPRPFAVDILVKTPQELAHSLEHGDFFIAEIVSQGRVLYEQSKESA